MIYFVSLQGQDVDGEQPNAPLPPNTFMYNGEAYVLHKSVSIRQSTEALPERTADCGSPEASVRVVSESILDMESQQKSSVCEVRDHNSGPELPLIRNYFFIRFRLLTMLQMIAGRHSLRIAID